MKRISNNGNRRSFVPIVFGLGETDAAGSFGISPSKFRELVKDGRAPKPRRIDGRMIWDVDELSAAFKDFPHVEGGEESDSWADVANSG